MKKKQIHTVVLTGGSGGGKSSLTASITETLLQHGWYPLVVEEVATRLINAGMFPEDDNLKMKTIDFQRIIFKSMLLDIEIFQEAAQKLPFEKVVIIYDRGLLDNQAYCTKSEFQLLLDEFHLKPKDIVEPYKDAMHLTTPAKGLSQFYTTKNNKARRDSVNQSIWLDNALLSAYREHPHRTIVPVFESFSEKELFAINAILGSIGIPERYETERRFLVKKPDLRKLRHQVEYFVSPIIQTYLLKDDSGDISRVRKRGNKDFGYLFYQTTKHAVSYGTVLETEDKLTPIEYEELLKIADPALNQLQKRRHNFIFDDRTYELDIFDNLPKTSILCPDEAILEVEVPDINCNVKIPEYIEVIKEITGLSEYNNYSLAKKINFG